MEAGIQAGAQGVRTQDLIATVSSISHSLMNEVSKVIIGKNENLRRVTVGILSNGNMLLEDFPGLAKTVACKHICTSPRMQVQACPIYPGLAAFRHHGDVHVRPKSR